MPVQKHECNECTLFMTVLNCVSLTVSALVLAALQRGQAIVLLTSLLKQHQ